MSEWVEFSKRIGVDYHIFEAKWHDGICYFDTNHTDWKTPEDYCKIFADESKKAGIPFMFYYSSVFDHNPQFDAIQPLRCCTPSFLCMHWKSKFLIARFSFALAVAAGILDKIKRLRRKIPYEDKRVKWIDGVYFNKFAHDPKVYEIYMFKQLIELIEKYKPDGMWMDWYMMKLESSANMIMEFMERFYPEVVLTFNSSIFFNLKWAHYLSYEAHDVNSAWFQGNLYRRKTRPWELVGPAASGWDNPISRKDPFEVGKIAAIIMACGGKFAFGMPAKMNGKLYAKPAKHLEILGKWYKKRKILFTESCPQRYRGKKVPGLKLEKRIGAICVGHEDDFLIHLFSLHESRIICIKRI